VPVPSGKERYARRTRRVPGKKGERRVSPNASSRVKGKAEGGEENNNEEREIIELPHVRQCHGKKEGGAELGMRLRPRREMVFHEARRQEGRGRKKRNRGASACRTCPEARKKLVHVEFGLMRKRKKSNDRGEKRKREEGREIKCLAYQRAMQHEKKRRSDTARLRQKKEGEDGTVAAQTGQRRRTNKTRVPAMYRANAAQGKVRRDLQWKKKRTGLELERQHEEEGKKRKKRGKKTDAESPPSHFPSSGKKQGDNWSRSLPARR